MSNLVTDFAFHFFWGVLKDYYLLYIFYQFLLNLCNCTFRYSQSCCGSFGLLCYLCWLCLSYILISYTELPVFGYVVLYPPSSFHILKERLWVMLYIETNIYTVNNSVLLHSTYTHIHEHYVVTFITKHWFWLYS